MNVFQDILGTLSTWLHALQQFVQAHPALLTCFDILRMVLPLGLLLAFAGMGFLSATARILSIRRKRASFNKCARQLALLAMLLGWTLLIGGRIWLFLSQGGYTPDSLPDSMLEISWLLLGLAVLMTSLYFALWKFLEKTPALHVAVGIICGIQACLAVGATLASTRLLAAFARPDAANLTLAHIYFPGWLTPFWCSLYWTLPLMLAMAGGSGAFWLALRRKYDDYGRDHYNIMIPWCAAWGRNAWLVFWLILLAARGLRVFENWRDGAFTPQQAAVESLLVLLWLSPALLWTVVGRSVSPLRHKPTLLLALLLALAFMQPYYLDMVNFADLQAIPQPLPGHRP